MTHVKKLFTKEPWKASVKSPKAKDWTEVVTNVAVDTLAGVVGGTGGSFLGAFAVPAGIALSATGHATGHRWLSAAGIAIIASPFDPGKAAAQRSANPGFSLKAEFDAGKERMKDYMEMLKEKFFINRISGNKSSEAGSETTDQSQTVNGIDPKVGKATLDMLTEIDQQVFSDGIEYQAKQGASPDNGAMVNGVVEIDELPHII